MDNTLSNGEAAKARIASLLTYDWGRLPLREASSMKHDLTRMCWRDEDTLYCGTGSTEKTWDTMEVWEDADMSSFEHKMPNVLYRHPYKLYPNVSKKAIDITDKMQIKPLQLSHGYQEFFFDILAGTLGTYKGINGDELWRRVNSSVDIIDNLEMCYRVKSTEALEIARIFWDILRGRPELAPKKVVKGVCVNSTLYGEFGNSKIDGETIPRTMIEFEDEPEIDLDRARALFELITPDEDSRHNLLLATVYPYFRDSSEKFFILKGVGGTGKSAFMKHFEVIMGDKYGTIDWEGLQSKTYERWSAISNLQGKLVMHSSDTKMTTANAISTDLKKLATGDKVTGRDIGKNSLSFRPDGVMYLDTNEQVMLPDDQAILRRKVGIMFAPRTLTHEEFNDYYHWIVTPSGACSILQYALQYYRHGFCMWDWRDVCIDDEIISREVDAVEQEMIERYYSSLNDKRKLGQKVWLPREMLMELNDIDLSKIRKKYDLRSTPRKGTRVWVVNNMDMLKAVAEEGLEEYDG